MAETDRCGVTWETRAVDSKKRSHCCARRTWRGYDRCIWHAETPEGVEKPVDELRDYRECESNRELNVDGRFTELIVDADLSNTELGDNISFQNCLLVDTGFTDAFFVDADFTRTFLENTDFAGAELTNADFSDSLMSFTNLVGAGLKFANLSNTDLRNADLTNANLCYANLTDADIRGADFDGADLTGTTLDGITLDQNTRLTRLPTEPSGFDVLNILPIGFSFLTEFRLTDRRRITDPDDWDALAQSYHQFKNKFSDGGHGENAREAYVLERKARTRQALFETVENAHELYSPEKKTRRQAVSDMNLFGFLGGAASGFLTGYGVRPRRVLTVSVAFLLFTTLWYALADFETTGSVAYYSITTFVTSPPNPPRGAGPFARAVVFLETYLGTVLTVLLGYVLGNRERI